MLQTNKLTISKNVTNKTNFYAYADEQNGVCKIYQANSLRTANKYKNYFPKTLARYNCICKTIYLKSSFIIHLEVKFYFACQIDCFCLMYCLKMKPILKIYTFLKLGKYTSNCDKRNSQFLFLVLILCVIENFFY